MALICEFKFMLDFFSSLDYVKRKYPICLSYMKYLENLKDDGDKKSEIDLFKRFLIQNPNIHLNKLDVEEYKTGKNSLVLYMPNFIVPDSTKTQMFWEQLNTINDRLFPYGKPANLQEYKPDIDNASILKRCRNGSRVLSDILDQMGDVNNLPDLNPEEVLKNEKLLNICSVIISNITSGKYNLSDITAFKSVLGTVFQNLPQEQQNLASTVTQVLHSMENREEVDINKLLQNVGAEQNLLPAITQVLQSVDPSSVGGPSLVGPPSAGKTSGVSSLGNHLQ